MRERPVAAVACVLRSGGEYRSEHVHSLRDQVAEHLPGAHFICLSDMDVQGVERKPLLWGWPGWWSKMELFCPGTFTGRVLFMDLDTVVTGDLSELAGYAGPLGIVRDFYRPERPQSCVMAWDGGGEVAAQLWRTFKMDPQGHMAAFRSDQDFIHSVVGDEWDALQDHAPGQIVSYKVHCQQGVPDGARVVCYHGKPRPWEVAA